MLLVDDDNYPILTKSALDFSDTWCHDIRSAYHMRNCPHVYGNSWHLFQSNRIRQDWHKLSLALEGDWDPIDKDDFRTLHRLGLDARFTRQMFETRNLVQIFNQRFGIAIFQDSSVCQINSVSCTTIFKSVPTPGHSLPQLNIECLMFRRRFSKRA